MNKENLAQTLAFAENPFQLLPHKMISFNDQFMPAKMDPFSFFNIQRYISSIPHKNTIKWHIQSSITMNPPQLLEGWQTLRAWPTIFENAVIVTSFPSISICQHQQKRENSIITNNKNKQQ